MKKLILFFAVIFASTDFTFAQAMLIVDAPQGNATTQVRAPNGLASSAYMRAAALVLQSELTSLPATSTVTQFGFTLTTGTSATPVSGNFTVYLQNTTDVTYLKGNTWSTILTGMTSVYASVMTIPLSASTTSILVTLSTPFAYAGGGIYVAYDWFSSGPFSSTPATYLAESLALNPGCASANSATTAITTLTTTPFRPTFLFGVTNTYTNDVAILGVEAIGRIPAILNSPHTIRAVVKNSSIGTLSNFSVNLNVVGANPFSNTQVVSSLAAGASTLISFAPFNPSQAGAQSVSVSVPSDQNNSNNAGTYSQSVTCDTWGQNPATGNYTYNSVGFGAGSGIIATPFLNPVTSTLTGLRGAVSTNTASVGNSVYGVLLNAIGAVVATTNTISLTNAMLGTFQSFYFSTPVNLTPGTTYYLGFAQMLTVNTLAYYPAGTIFSAYLPPNLYYSVGLGGGPPAVVAQNYGYFGLEAIFAHTVTISAAPQSVSCGNSATLNAISSTNYSWSTGASTSSIVVSPTVSSVYSVSASNTLGCYASKTVSVTVNPITLTVTSSPSVVCSGDQVFLSAAGANSFTWTFGSTTLTTGSINDSPLAPTNYTLYGLNPSGCSASLVFPLFVNPLPIVNASSSTPSICVGGTVNLFASGTANSYSWSTSQTGSPIMVNPVATNNYTVTGTSAAGCSKSNTITVMVDSFTPGITSSTAICKGDQITLTSTGATTLVWSNFSQFSSITVTPQVTTVYSVTGSGANGCQGSNATTVTVNASPTVVAVASRTSICKSETSSLTVSGATSYSWSSGQTTSLVVVSPTSTILYTYSVTGSFSTGCSNTAQVSLKVNACTGLLELRNSEGIRIYPNPGNGRMTLHCEAFTEELSALVIDALGRTVYKGELNDQDTELDISQEANGIYFVNIQEKGKTVKVLKVIKQ